MKILSGTSNLKLSKDISKNLKLKLINTNIRRFADKRKYKRKQCICYSVNFESSK